MTLFRYQELFRTVVDEDNAEGPYGHREHRKPEGLDILPMLTDSELYKEFYAYAVNDLQLSPLT